MREEIATNHVLFTQGAWEIHAEFEDSEWVEIFHYCNRKDKVGEHIVSSYQLPNDTHCPGCDAIQPDEIQALVQMHNMDRPAREYGQSLQEMMRKDYEQIFAQAEKKLFLRGNGVNE